MAKSLTPTISVVMTVYNGARYVRQAIDSILAQTYKDFELIIVDDGSTDQSLKIVQGYKDPRIHLIEATHQGLVAALNKGIEAARGELVARHDADDASLPQRFEIQRERFRHDSTLVIVGSSMQVMDGQSKILHTHAVLLNDPELREELLVRSPFAHGSVMMRRQALIDAGQYHSDEWPSEDYGLWLRLTTRGKLANIDQPLYIYREHSSGISAQNHQAQLAKKTAIQESAWRVRRQLLPAMISTTDYLELEMGQFRIERIARNLLFVIRKALRSFDLAMATKAIRLLLGNPQLRRKLARFILIQARVKHG